LHDSFPPAHSLQAYSKFLKTNANSSYLLGLKTMLGFILSQSAGRILTMRPGTHLLRTVIRGFVSAN
jgi:hypothetical protein